MKRILIILALAMISMVCNAQIRYLGTTNNRQSTETQQYQQYQEPQQQVISTTAYYQSGNGYVKLPIRVTIQGNKIMPTMYYQQNVVGGQWYQFTMGTTAQVCRSMSHDPLESQFMYKCSVVRPAVTTIYFDL